ncbi:hypothetical protein [Rhodococcus daqingensis]|uniref:Immunity protein Imm1 n=1 Tax=Rhodococcus daqingensis TaxID=2479363 RepID=A0ABW2RVA1_9NOCA
MSNALAVWMVGKCEGERETKLLAGVHQLLTDYADLLREFGAEPSKQALVAALADVLVQPHLDHRKLYPLIRETGRPFVGVVFRRIRIDVAYYGCGSCWIDVDENGEEYVEFDSADLVEELIERLAYECAHSEGLWLMAGESLNDEPG